MKEALLNWYRAMNEAGRLKEKGMVVKEFVMGTSQASGCRSDA